MPRPVIMALVLVVTVAVARRRLRHVVVVGPSMQPTIVPGDRLVLLRVPGRPRAGELVITIDPRGDDRKLLKRVHAVRGDAVDVRGDNPRASTDSRAFGVLPITAVERCVAWRYAPRGRIERVARVSWWRAPADRARSPRPDPR